MRYYILPNTNVVVTDKSETIVATEQGIYARLLCEPQEGWQEITQAEFETIIGCVTPIEAQTVDEQLAEVKENQLILMNAVATLYETMTGGTA